MSPVVRSSRLYQLVLLAIAVASATYARSTVGPLQEAMGRDLGWSDDQMAVLQGIALALPMAIGSVPLGLWVDRHSRARLFLLFTVLNLAVTLATALLSEFALLFVARLLVGLSMAAVLVAVYSTFADLFPAQSRGRAAMMLAFGEIAGAPAAFGLGGYLLSHVASGAAAWRTAMLWLAVPLVPVALLMLTLREPQRTGVSTGSPALRNSPALRDVWLELLRLRHIIAPLLLARILVWVADGAVVVWAVPMLIRTFGVSAARAGAIVGGAFLFSGLVSPFIGGPLADLCHRKGGPRLTFIALATLALLSVPAASFGLTQNITLSAVLLGSFLTLGYGLHLVALAAGTIVIPGELRGVYLAITVMAAAIFGTGLAPLAVSITSHWLGGPSGIGTALSLVCICASLVSAAVFAAGRRYFPVAAAHG